MFKNYHIIYNVVMQALSMRCYANVLGCGTQPDIVNVDTGSRTEKMS